MTTQERAKNLEEQVQAQVELLEAELKAIDGALDDPRANLTLTTAEIKLKQCLQRVVCVATTTLGAG